MGRQVWLPVLSGPLAPYAPGFESWLRSRAYSSSAVAGRLSQLAQLSRWLEREGHGADDLTDARAAEFASTRRERGLVLWSSPGSAELPLEYLREIGVVSAPEPTIERGPLEELLVDYGRYLLLERRLSEDTVRDLRVPAARLFLAGREGPDGLGLERLSAADVSLFLARECPKRSMSGARDLVCALRSFLRFLHLAGLTEASLVWAVPSVADLRDRTLPRGLERSAVRKLLASCDRRTLVGRRDYAVGAAAARRPASWEYVAGDRVRCGLGVGPVGLCGYYSADLVGVAGGARWERDACAPGAVAVGAHEHVKRRPVLWESGDAVLQLDQRSARRDVPAEEASGEQQCSSGSSSGRGRDGCLAGNERGAGRGCAAQSAGAGE